jgi:drug/metabolite transporter (DMT)-like permease
MASNPNKLPSGAIAVLAVAALSFAGPLTKEIRLDSVTLFAWRCDIAYLAMAGMFPRSCRPFPVLRLAKTAPARLITSAVAFMVFLELWTLSLKYIPLGLSVVFVSMSSIAVFVLTCVRRRSISARASMGVALGIGSLVPAVRTASAFSTHSALGIVLALLAAAGATIYYVLASSTALRADALQSWGAITLISGILMTLVSSVERKFLGAVHWRTLVLLIALAILVHIVGQGLLAVLAADGDPVLATVALVGESIGTSILALAFFREPIRWTLILTIGCFGTCIFLLQNVSSDLPAPEDPMATP